jgi:Na+-driven multidrug efflux pump
MRGSLYRQYFRYTVPTIAAMLVNGLYQLVDGIFIGQYVGSPGLAAINIAWAMTGVIVGVGLLVGVGTGSLASIRKGEQNLQSAKQTLSTGLILLLFLSILIFFGVWLFARQILL